jgi:glutamyl-tRNA reductase
MFFAAMAGYTMAVGNGAAMMVVNRRVSEYGPRFACRLSTAATRQKYVVELRSALTRRDVVFTSESSNATVRKRESTESCRRYWIAR